MTDKDIQPIEREFIKDTESAHRAVERAFGVTNDQTQEIYYHVMLIYGVMDSKQYEQLGELTWNMPAPLRYTGHLRNDCRAMIECCAQMTDLFAQLQAIGIPMVCSKLFEKKKREVAKGQFPGKQNHLRIMKDAESLFTYTMPKLVEAFRMHKAECEELIRVADRDGYADLLPNDRKDPMDGVAFLSKEFNDLSLNTAKKLGERMRVIDKFFGPAEGVCFVLPEYNVRTGNIRYLQALYDKTQEMKRVVDNVLYTRKLLAAYQATAKKEGVLEALREAAESIHRSLDEYAEIFLGLRTMWADFAKEQHRKLSSNGNIFHSIGMHVFAYVDNLEHQLQQLGLKGNELEVPTDAGALWDTIEKGDMDLATRWIGEVVEGLPFLNQKIDEWLVDPITKSPKLAEMDEDYRTHYIELVASMKESNNISIYFARIDIEMLELYRLGEWKPTEESEETQK